MAMAPPLTRETTIRRTKDGTWFHDGEKVENPAVAKAFDRWVGRAEDGRYILKNAVNWAYVDIEGPPLFVRRAHVEAGELWLTFSNDDRKPLAADTLRVDPEGRLFCTAVDSNLSAGFSRRAMLDVAEHLEAHGTEIRLELGDRQIPVRSVEDPLCP